MIGSLGGIADDNRQRCLDWFERLGEDKVRLYAQLDGERFFGDWPTRQLAWNWLAHQEEERRGRRRRARLRRTSAVVGLLLATLAALAGGLVLSHHPPTVSDHGRLTSQAAAAR